MWAIRAKSEIAASVRTWFGTMTCSPDRHHAALLVCRQRLTEQGGDFDALPQAAIFNAIALEEGKLITDFLKRVRKETSAPLRYLFCVEQHKSGWPHWHCLLHEQSEQSPVRKSLLERQWIAGLSHWRLVPMLEVEEAAKAVHYITKYVAKTDVQARIRASIEYGDRQPQASTTAVQTSVVRKLRPPDRFALNDVKTEGSRGEEQMSKGKEQTNGIPESV